MPATRIYPHPKITVPQTIHVPGKPPDPDLDAVVASRAAFDEPLEHKAMLWAAAGSVLDVDGTRQPAFAHGPVGGQANAVDMKPSWKYAAEVLADSPLWYAPWTAGPPQVTNLYPMGPNLGSSGGSLGLGFTDATNYGSPAGPTAWTPSKGLSFPSGAVKYVAASVNDWFNTNSPRTYECWWYRGQAIGDGSGEMLFASSAPADGQPYSYVLRSVTSGNATVAFSPRGNAGGAGSAATWSVPIATLPDQTWAHIAFTWSGSSRNVELFINGVKFGATVTVTLDFNGTPAFGPLFGDWYQGAHIWAMRANSAAADIAVYPAALAAGRIAAHYAAR